MGSSSPTPIPEQTEQGEVHTSTPVNTQIVTEDAWLATETPAQDKEKQNGFQGDRALEDITVQVGFGPRIPGSPAHEQTIDYIQSELEEAGWDSRVQQTRYGGHEIRNIIATRGDLEQVDAPWIVLGAHYDTRLVADRDQDPAKQNQPGPGANDGASGVAVLLEMARSLPEDLDKRVWLVFFDAEDNGRIPGWDWILGSTAFVQALDLQPSAAVIVDMVGDADQNIYLEQNSDPELAAEIWQVAEDLGYGDRIINSPGKRILDDHVPFLEAGIPAVDIIDIDYPYWHTTEDTLDKIAPESIQAVGDTLLAWLNQPWSR